MNQPDDLKTRQIRWRLILEAGTESILGQTPDGLWQQRADALTFLYDREYGSRNVRPGGSGGSGQRTPSGQGAAGSTGTSHPPQPNPGQNSQTPGTQGQPSPGSKTQSPGTPPPPKQSQGAQQPGAGSELGVSDTGNTAGQAQGQSTSNAPNGQPSDRAGNQKSSGSGESAHGPSAQTAQDGVSGPKDSTEASPGTESSGQGANCTGAGQGGAAQGQGSSPSSGPGTGNGTGEASRGDSTQRGDQSGPPSQERHGGLGPSQLTVPDWINAIYELFPQKTIERLERDALERYHLEEMVTNPDLLSRAEPSPTLLKAVLRTKHLMNQDVLAMARLLVQRTIADLMEQLAREVQSPFLGAVNRQRRSWLKVAKNFDAETTIRQNLSTYDPETKRLFIKTPYFHSRIRRQMERWQIIIVVDESGSMLDSVIHAAVTAAIFYQIKQVRTHLCILIPLW